MIDCFREDPRLQTAALVGWKFNMDPVQVLKSTYQDWAIRVAALQHVTQLEEEAHSRQRQAKMEQSRVDPRIG